MSRQLPSAEDALRILAVKRTRRTPRPAPPVGRPLQSLIKQLDAKFGAGTGPLVGRWREIVGETLAAHTEPSKLSKPRAGVGAVIRRSPAVRSAAQAALARRRRAQPLDAAAEAELQAGLAAAEDGKLKAALLRLGREVLRRQGSAANR